MFGKLKTIRIALVAVFALMATAMQAQTVTGVVKDATGEPVIGATVMEVGTKNGTVTDFDGNFTIKLQSKGNLNISYVGMKSQIVKTAGKTNVDVVLEDDSNTLGDVVVVGYGTMKKSDLTGSVSSIETEKLNAKGASTALANLQGAVAGVNITQSSGRSNGGFDIEIRGKSSTNSSTKPIYVIDGVICDDMDFLNPQDIERIDVLKDASSTAIYGSRATAGVVMVTTKSGAGVGKKQDTKPSVSYDGYVGITQAARMPDFMNGQEFYNYRFLKFLTYAEGGAATPQSGQPGYTMGTYPQMALWKTETDLDQYPLGGYSRLKYMVDNDLTTNWPDLVTQNGIQQNHYLALSGSAGNGDVHYHMGVGYNAEEGMYDGDSRTQVSFKGSLDAKVTKWLTTGFTVNLASMKNSYADDNGVQYAYRMNPFMQPTNAEGVRNDKPGDYISMGSDNGYQFSDQPNPLLLLENQKKERQTYRALGTFYLSITPMKGLSLKSTFAPSYTQYREGTFNAQHELIKDYAESNRAINTQYNGLSWTWTTQANFNKTFNEKHSIDLLALNEIVSGSNEKLSVTSRDVLNGSDWYNVGSASDPTTGSYSSSYSESGMISYALRANYSYAGKYMATATMRWDGSSKFAKGHRWGAFPSFALAWRASEEDFLKNVDWLSNLKLRLAYGVTGNNKGVGNYATQQTVALGHYYPFGGVHYNGGYPSGVIDQALSWERSHEVNFGIDFGFLRNRINGSIDIYQKTSKDLLYSVTLPLEAGMNGSSAKTLDTNVGSVRNRGIEFQINTVNVQTKDWNWTTSLNFAHNQNKVREINGTGSDLPANSLFIGRPINNVYSYEWTGIVSDRMMTVPDNDAAKKAGYTPGSQMRECDYYYGVYGWTEGNVIIDDVDGNGTIDDDDKKVFSSDPKWTGSFTSNLSYKNWDFSFSLYAKQGYKVASNFLDEYTNWGDRGRNHLQVDYYIPAGTLIDCDGITTDGLYINPVFQEQTHYGSYPFPNNAAASSGVGDSHWLSAANKLTDASFVKVKNITLGYTFDKKILSHVGIQKLRLYFTVTNPFVFTKYKGFDPEWAGATNKNDGPSTISYQFGASLKF